MQQIESHIQRACVAWFRWQYPQIEPLFFAVPNGGKRSIKTAVTMRDEGVRAGVADLILLVPRHGYASLCIEMKTKNGRQSDAQKLFQVKAEKYGNKYVVCRSFDEFREIIQEYLNNDGKNRII